MAKSEIDIIKEQIATLQQRLEQEHQKRIEDYKELRTIVNREIDNRRNCNIDLQNQIDGIQETECAEKDYDEKEEILECLEEVKDRIKEL